MERKVLLLMIVSMCLSAVAESAISFYSMDQSSYPDPYKLVTYDSESSNSNVSIIADIPDIVANPTYHHAAMDYSSEGRLFIAPYGYILYEIDPGTGATLGSFDVGGWIEGVAVSENGLVYINRESDATIWEVDFDQQIKQLVLNRSSDVDDIDFDSEGNLIGIDINGHGNIYRLPLVVCHI
jgi:hypothetical protein